MATLTHIKSLFNNPKHSDITLASRTGDLPCHRCVLVMVPTFEKLLSNPDTKTLNVDMTLPHLSAFIKTLYGFPVDECLPSYVGEIQSIIASVKQHFSYEPFINAAWKRVLKLREEVVDTPKYVCKCGTDCGNDKGSKPEAGVVAKTPQRNITIDERAASIRFAAHHKLPIKPYVADGDAMMVDYESVIHLIRDHTLTDAKMAGKVAYCAVKWMEYHQDKLKEAQALTELCHLERWTLLPVARNRLVKLSKESTLNAPAYKLIISVLSQSK